MRIAFFVDEARDPSPMNAGQRMARIAVGAALENVLRTAERNRWGAFLEEPVAPAVATVRLEPGPQRDIDPAIAARVTNRRPYDGQAVSAEILAKLKEQTPPLDDVVTHWMADRQRLPPLADLIGRADAVMFGNPTMRKAFLANVRFDAAPDAEVDEGLSLASLELSRGERFGLRMMRWLPNWLLHAAGAMKTFAANTRRLVESAAGLCLVTAADRRPATDLVVGRAMQRAWLALTEQGLAAQPMMSMAVLENVLDQGSPQVVTALGPERVQGLLSELRRLAGEVGDGRLAYLLRWGYAGPVGGRTGRLPLARVAQERPMASGPPPT